MKCHIPQISWHNRDPVLSIDLQTAKNGTRRIATAGTDSHVLIWLLNVMNDDSNVDLECVADLSRHSKTVNIVRFSPNGEILASADDEAAIILWRHQPRQEEDIFADDDASINKENWTPIKILRGHIDDICDLSWSHDSKCFVTGSVDNTAIVWDVTKGKNLGLLSDHKGFVQGVAWDPLGKFVATLCSDRTLRIFNLATRKVVHRVHKALLPNSNKEPQENPPKPTRIFYDDTLKSFCRRLTFSPCGQLLIVPTGIVEENEGKFSNATYVFTRNNFNKPVLYLPTADKFTLVVRCCPMLFQLRKTQEAKETSSTAKQIDSTDNGNAGQQHSSLFSLPYRVVFAVATQDSILFYDSQQAIPFAKVSNIHFTRLCDLSWSADGKLLMASSTDGYCSFVLFADGELGTPYVEETLQKEQKEEFKKPLQEPPSAEKVEDMEWSLVLEADTNESPPISGSSQQPETNVTDSGIKELSKEMDKAQISETDKNMNIRNQSDGDNYAPASQEEKKCNSAKSAEAVVDQCSSGDVKKDDRTVGKTPRRIQLVTLSKSVKKE